MPTSYSLNTKITSMQWNSLLRDRGPPLTWSCRRIGLALSKACKVNLALSIYITKGVWGRRALPWSSPYAQYSALSFPTHTSFPLKQSHTLPYSKQVPVNPLSFPLTVASLSSNPCWEAPKFSFTSPQQSDDWKAFYMRAINFLEALNIHPKKLTP